jgi:hypothetical protein
MGLADDARRAHQAAQARASVDPVEVALESVKTLVEAWRKQLGLPSPSDLRLIRHFRDEDADTHTKVRFVVDGVPFVAWKDSGYPPFRVYVEGVEYSISNHIRSIEDVGAALEQKRSWEEYRSRDPAPPPRRRRWWFR